MKASEHVTEAEEEVDAAADRSKTEFDSPSFNGRLMIAVVRTLIARVKLRASEVAERGRYTDAYQERTELLREQFQYQVAQDAKHDADQARYLGK